MTLGSIHKMDPLQIEGTECYLLPTIHCFDSAPILPSNVEKVFRYTRRFISEADPKQGLLPEQLVYSKGESLKQHLPPPLYAELSDLWRELEIRDDLSATRDWRIMIILGQFLRERAGFRDAYSIDAYLVRRARNYSKNVRYLETVEAAVMPLMSPPLEIRKSIADILRDPDKVVRHTRAFVEGWRNNSTEPFLAVWKEAAAMCPEMMGAAIGGRNRAWMSAITDYIRDGIPTLIGTGAMHFVGTDSLPDLLKSSGFKLRNVS
jgi:uncharacterized protein YbaP (TraB family)